jgi:hypothetical protein
MRASTRFSHYRQNARKASSQEPFRMKKFFALYHFSSFTISFKSFTFLDSRGNNSASKACSLESPLLEV